MDITAITVNYNTPDLLNNMITSFRKFYDIKILVIDGSEEPIDYDYDNVTHYRFRRNIHHGGGLAYGLGEVETSKALFIDSDVVFHCGGFLERLNEKLLKTSYGIGDVQIIDEKGFNKRKGIKYLHPAFCLLNMDVVMKFKMPIVHGAPMIEAMKDIHNKRLDILQHEEWVTNDFRNEKKFYLTHDWQGTVKKYGYNL